MRLLTLPTLSLLIALPVQAVERPLSLPAQVILGSQSDDQNQQPLTRSVLSDAELSRQQLGANVSEPLQRLPGILALNRQNYAQDLQISSRGFGARAAFGVRGVRLVQDGIPLTMPDGQGQPALFDLDALQRLEVLRGPLTTLYGNASGGIIQGFSSEAPFHPTLNSRSAVGSDGLWRSRLRYGAQHGDLNINANIARLHTDGYRDHSQTRRDSANLRLGWDIDDVSSLTLLLNSLDQPNTRDPLGLSAEQLRQDRRQAVSQSQTFNTRKSVRHQQAGLNYQRRLGNDDQLTLMAYGGERFVQQYLGFAGAGEFAGGGVVELDRRFGGVELGWQRSSQVFGRPVELAAGLTYDYQGEQRDGFVNDNGHKGQRKRDEFNRVDSQEAYLISTWQLAPRWQLTAGLRHSRIQFDSDDDFFADGQDDSGKVRYQRSNPAAGLSWQWTPQLSLYGALGQGFETPTFQELAYRPSGSGLNFALKPSLSRNAELGMKWRHADGYLDLALFESRVRDEIVPGENQVGTDRSTFTNAGRSTRRGLELALEQQFEHGLRGYLAYTWLQARFDRYRRADGSDLSGRDLPGTARQSLYAELAWQPAAQGFSTAVELQALSQRYASDDNQAKAPGYAVLNWRAGYRQALGGWLLEPFLRIDNLTDRDYIGSLIINEPRTRYYEPAPGRQWLAGVGLEYQWR
ncbi:TonB-dependent receptor family protein [Pseudomonas jilinensis]|uniref:TonB-dependent siderophore receptor n=1 Tax=Pseudomonas jilinensis TaxID=2078689 RepID=A0A396RYL0_9PSED|nr:TonB-dependent receptor [Pseudomonas jilinensis]RHW20522.1 TonB-dependent siderophore receptor [Pseudomonas jilinensis]